MKFQMLAIFAVLPLVACGGQNKHVAMAGCEMKARQTYPNQAGNETALGEAGDYTFECMEAKGYVRINDLTRCPLGRGRVGELDESCYRKPWPWE
jgi:hypothetical protein